MPKTPIDYSKTIIYKLVHKDDLNDENIYTGHTTDVRNRKYMHKNGCNNIRDKTYNQKKYKYIRENGGWDEWFMIEIEKYPCKDKQEALARERQIQTEMKAKLNSNIPGRTIKEYYEDNHEKIKIYKKQYHRDNCDKIRDKSKKHYEENRDKKLEYQNQRYYDNKEKINEKKKEKIACDKCGSIVRKCDMARHHKTTKCINHK